jgi:hypothetical protein
MIIGVTLKFKTTKNKTFTPLKTGQFILFTCREKLGQVDHIDEVVRYAVTSGVIKHSGPSYTLGEHKLLGMENLVEYIKENNLVDSLYEEIKKVYK